MFPAATDDERNASLGLSPGQLQAWERDGYLVIPGALPLETVDKLLAESQQMLEEFSLDGHPMTRFSTGGVGEDDDEGQQQQRKHVGDEYFLASSDKIRFFFEEDAFDSNGTLLKPKSKAINKIGHALHALSPPFKAISMNPANAAIAHSLGFRDPRVLQSMVICKQPEIGGAVPSHQDSTFLYTNPPSAVGFWYALEDTTEENGSLSFLPGSHKTAGIRKRFVRLPEGGTGFEGLRDGEVDGLRGEEGRREERPWEMRMVKRGSLVLIHGNVEHKSEKNLSGKSRFIYTFHVIEGENTYDERNWLQPGKEGFSKLNDVVYK